MNIENKTKGFVCVLIYTIGGTLWPQLENAEKNGNTLLDIRTKMANHEENQIAALPKKVMQFRRLLYKKSGFASELCQFNRVQTIY